MVSFFRYYGLPEGIIPPGLILPPLHSGDSLSAWHTAGLWLLYIHRPLHPPCNIFPAPADYMGYLTRSKGNIWSIPNDVGGLRHLTYSVNEKVKLTHI